MKNPTVFVVGNDGGLGLIALDDLYQIHQRTGFADGRAEIRDEQFGLRPHASYAIEWAVYPTATTDYFDFINQVRKDEGINGHIDGSLGAVLRDGQPPSEDVVNLLSLKHARLRSRIQVVDDPEVSLEGFEFFDVTRYPKECATLKDTFAACRSRYPGIGVGLHLAHGLYATNRPAELFPDSRALDEDGKQVQYGPNTMEYYGRWFSKQRFEEGWRWWIFYPTAKNRFGKMVLQATEFMLTELGATDIWADGFFCGYVPGCYSYDRWDGHSVTIDPKTKLVSARKTSVALVTIPVLKKIIQMIRNRGGVVFTNDPSGGSRSFWKEANLVTSNESNGGAESMDGLLLGRTVTPLGDPSFIKNERDIYLDILRKLDQGALYFWLGQDDLVTHKTLVEHMYPITFESIHAGTVRGKERIITKRSGVYGWPGDRSLHIVYLYDANGVLTRSDFTATVDAAGVRTEVTLQADQAAAIVKLPATVTASAPINVRVQEYDSQGLRMDLNGTPKMTLHLADGPLPVKEGAKYQISAVGKTWETTANAKGLTVVIDIDGAASLTITPLANR